MYTREITGALIGTFILTIILFAPSFVFKLALFGIFILAFIELCFLIRRPYWPSLLVIFFIITSLFLVETYEANRLLFLYSILISVLNDSGAYYLGKKYGSRRVFPKTSPNKTLEGLISGILISSCILYLINFQEFFKFNINYLDNQNSFLFFILLISSVVAVFGDYLESKIKRSADVKILALFCQDTEVFSIELIAIFLQFQSFLYSLELFYEKGFNTWLYRLYWKIYY